MPDGAGCGVFDFDAAGVELVSYAVGPGEVLRLARLLALGHEGVDLGVVVTPRCGRDEPEDLLLVGHNPFMEDLCGQLTRGSMRRFSTATLVALERREDGVFEVLWQLEA